MGTIPERPLPRRTIEILHQIVECYIRTGEPVASRAVARLRGEDLSAATVRNVMADLADAGYLDQPHTSAGRVPTGKAFEHFARSIAAGRILAGELERLRGELYPKDSVEERARHSSHLLTEWTHNVGIVAAIPSASKSLDQVEFVLLPDTRVLMVVLTRDGAVTNQVARLDEPVTQDELATIRNYVNRNFSGWSIDAIRRELGRRLERDSAAYDTLLRKLTLLYEKGLLDIGLQPVVFLEGASNLVGLDLHLTKEKLRELFRALEEKKRLMQLLDQLLEGRDQDVTVRVGLGEAHPSMKHLSLIGLTVPLGGGQAARMAVLGPLHMNYPRVISAVLHVGQALRTLPQ